jgi:hypothetical protein
VYAGEEDEYFSFITLEAYQALQDWMNYREHAGENITEGSWLMRDLWDVSKPYGKGLITRPKKLASLGVKRLMERAIWAQGLRKKLENGKRRHPFQANHSLRKWFKTRFESGMLPINVETLFSHETGISDSYYRPTEAALLDDYVTKAAHMLTINQDKTSLENYVDELERKNKETHYIMKGELEERDDIIQKLSQKLDKVDQFIQSLIDSGQVKPN